MKRPTADSIGRTDHDNNPERPATFSADGGMLYEGDTVYRMGRDGKLLKGEVQMFVVRDGEVEVEPPGVWYQVKARAKRRKQ